MTVEEALRVLIRWTASAIYVLGAGSTGGEGRPRVFAIGAAAVDAFRGRSAALKAGARAHRAAKGTLFVIDEPSGGFTPRTPAPSIETLGALVEEGARWWWSSTSGHRAAAIG